jgi:putative phosphoesterase
MLCILSDTHENLPVIRKAVALIRSFSPNLVIHCGDIISPPTLEEFKGLPMRFVLGNNDGEVAGLAKKCAELNFGEISDELELTYENRRFYVYHGTRENLIDEMAGSQLYDYVLHGHTHKMRDERLGRTRIINPGALFMPKPKGSRYTIATLDAGSDTLKFHTIE